MKKTKRLLNNDQLIKILSASKNATAIYASEDIIIEFANAAMLAFWGKDSNVIGQSLDDGVPELKGQPFKQVLQKVWKTGITDFGVIPAETMIEGTLQTRYYEYEYRAITSDTDVVYGLLHTANDVTEKILGQQAVDFAEKANLALTKEQILNEELLTANEELISTNEELVLAQENLQNLNLELDERVKSRTQDLTESEARFRSMAEGSGILIAVADETRNFIYLSKAWTALTGHILEELLGFGWIDTLHPADRQRTLDLYVSSFKDHDTFTAEFRVRNSKTEYRWLLANGMPRLLPNGVFAGYIISCMDITDIKDVERRKDDFISIASHELKTPLTSLKASLQILDRMKNQFDSKPLSNLLGQANKSMDKITGLVNDLLNSSRAGEGHLPLNKTTFIVADMLNKCCNHVRAGGKYNLIFQGNKELKIHADEDRIEQVVVNFVNNAVKYAPQSKDIFLKAEKMGKMAKISVRDTGPGIQKDQIPRLFERYYRSNYTGAKYSGLGLGLYIGSEIIQRHGGKIGVDTELGKGSTFWFTLPLE